MVDAVMRLVSDIATDVFDGIKKYRRRPLFTSLVDKASEWGMTDPRDMALFCAIQLNSGDRLFKTACWLSAAEKVRQGEMTWSIALDITLKNDELQES